MKLERPDPNIYKTQPIEQNVAIELQNMSVQEKEYETYVKLTEWYHAWQGRCYVSFSGGKDSTLMAYLAACCFRENGWKETPLILMFCDTGLEYPEIREFVPWYTNWLQEQFPDVNIKLEIRKPEMNFRRVIERYGYPVISKDVSHVVKVARNCPDGKCAARLRGGKTTSMINWEKYAYLLDAPFKIGSNCCDVMKKRPAKKFEKEAGLVPIIATMAAESLLRKRHWKQHGCNAYDGERPASYPMSFWTEQDVLFYLKDREIPICSVYGEIIEENGKYKTTGCERTGCMFCAFGATNDKEPTRFQRLAKTHPVQYAWMMKPWEEGGLGLKEVLDYIHAKY